MRGRRASHQLSSRAQRGICSPPQDADPSRCSGTNPAVFLATRQDPIGKTSYPQERTIAVTYSCARNYLPSSFLIVRREFPHAAFVEGRRREFHFIAGGCVLRTV